MKKGSPAMQLMNLVWMSNGHRMGRSSDRVDHAMREAMCLAIKYGFEFAPGDFAAMSERYGASCPESLYKLACQVPSRYSAGRRYGCNRSACISFERWKKRKPFILDGSQRLSVMAWFEWYGEQVECTSFSEGGEHLVACSYKEQPIESPKPEKVLHRYRITVADLREHRAAGRKLKQLRQRVVQIGDRVRKTLGDWTTSRFKGVPDLQLRLPQLMQIEQKLDELAGQPR